MKRAQLQALETIIVAIVLILLVLLGLFVYTVMNKESSQQNTRAEMSEQALTIGIRLSNMMELSCSQKGRENSVCLDLLKAELLSEWLTNPNNPNYDDSIRLQYADIFGDRDLIIRELYPGTENELVLFDGLASENYLTQFVPVVLYDPRDGTHVLGEIEVRG